MSHKPWYHKGLQFTCQGSGKCCVSRGQYGFVYLTREDRRNLAKELGLDTAQFTRQYCDKDGDYFHLRENDNGPDCLFLVDNKCSVYKGRPTQCRTWPFWPEVMKPKTWKKEVVDFCPGANKGRLYTALEIKSLVKEQEESEEKMLSERTSS